MTENEKSLRAFKAEDDNEYVAMFKELMDLKDDLEEKQKTAVNERKRINQWEETYTEPLKSRINFIETQIKNKYQQELAENPKAKVNTPWGKVSKRTTTTYDYGDEKELIVKIKDIAPELVKVKTEESLNKVEFKKMAQVTETGSVCLFGEIVDGVTAEKTTSYKVETV